MRKVWYSCPNALESPGGKGQNMFGFLAMCAYVLVTGDYPGATLMGFEEDSALVNALLSMRVV